MNINPGIIIAVIIGILTALIVGRYFATRKKP